MPSEVVRVSLNEGSGSHLVAHLGERVVNLAGPVELNWTPNSGPFGFAPVLAEKQSLLIGDAGDFETAEPFSFGAWVFVPKDFKGEGTVLARMGGEQQKNRG